LVQLTHAEHGRRVGLVEEARLHLLSTFRTVYDFARAAVADLAPAAADPRMLSHGKIRTCAIGPELVMDAPFDDVRGAVRVERVGACLWSREVAPARRTGPSRFSANTWEGWVSCRAR
jgi:hypothetical protein